jgi:hypothetical protein
MTLVATTSWPVASSWAASTFAIFEKVMALDAEWSSSDGLVVKVDA